VRPLCGLYVLYAECDTFHHTRTATDLSTQITSTINTTHCSARLPTTLHRSAVCTVGGSFPIDPIEACTQNMCTLGYFVHYTTPSLNHHIYQPLSNPHIQPPPPLSCNSHMVYPCTSCVCVCVRVCVCDSRPRGHSSSKSQQSGLATTTPEV
jgi:hypothetical protein